MPPRKRVVKQVKKEKAEDVRPISEEELTEDQMRMEAQEREADSRQQEAEIAALRKNAQKDKATGRMYLDALLGFCLFVFIRQLHRYRSGESSAPTVLVLVTLAQTILLPFSVTPERLPVVGRYLAGYHHLVVLAQLILFVGSFVLQVGRVPIPELLRAAMPELLAFSVETQRRAERSNDAALDKLERLKYPLKGA